MLNLNSRFKNVGHGKTSVILNTTVLNVEIMEYKFNCALKKMCTSVLCLD